MNWLELVGAITLGYLSLSLLISIVSVIYFLIDTRKEGNLKVPFVVLKIILLVLLVALCWPLILVQLAEMSANDGDSGYEELWDEEINDANPL